MRFLGKGLVYVFVIVMAALTLFPFLYMLSSSLMTYQEVTSIPPTIVPHVPQWHNFIEAMRQAPFPVISSTRYWCPGCRRWARSSPPYLRPSPW